MEAQDVAALARTQTVGEVAEAMIAELRNVGGGGQPVAWRPQPRRAAAAAAAAVRACLLRRRRAWCCCACGEDGVRAGHDRDGHGSGDGAGRRLIKRVEILSDVQKELDVEAQDVAALARTQTVGEVVEAMIAELRNVGGGGSAPVAGTGPRRTAAAAAAVRAC